MFHPQNPADRRPSASQVDDRFDIDYNKRFLREFQSRGDLPRAFYWTAVIEDQEFSSIRPLIDWLDYMVTRLQLSRPRVPPGLSSAGSAKELRQAPQANPASFRRRQ
jgi:hypothetical protein